MITGKLCILFTEQSNECSLFFPTSDSSYDAVRRTGWSNNMHSGKGEYTVIIVVEKNNDGERTLNVGNFIILCTLKDKSCARKVFDGCRHQIVR